MKDVEEFLKIQSKGVESEESDSERIESLKKLSSKTFGIEVSIIEAAKRILEDNGYEVKLKSKWVNGERGVIAIDQFGRKFYEDIVHNENGYYVYYIQTQEDEEGNYIIPERDDIPKRYWGKKSKCRWFKWF